MKCNIVYAKGLVLTKHSKIKTKLEGKKFNPLFQIKTLANLKLQPKLISYQKLTLELA